MNTLLDAYQEGFLVSRKPSEVKTFRSWCYKHKLPVITIRPGKLNGCLTIDTCCFPFQLTLEGNDIIGNKIRGEWQASDWNLVNENGYLVVPLPLAEKVAGEILKLLHDKAWRNLKVGEVSMFD